MKKSELIKIYGGGFKLTASFLNAASRGINVLLDTGRAIGSAIRRFQTKSYC